MKVKPQIKGLKIKPEIKGLGIRAEVKPSAQYKKMIRDGIPLTSKNKKGRRY